MSQNDREGDKGSKEIWADFRRAEGQSQNYCCNFMRRTGLEFIELEDPFTLKIHPVKITHCPTCGGKL